MVLCCCFSCVRPLKRSRSQPGAVAYLSPSMWLSRVHVSSRASEAKKTLKKVSSNSPSLSSPLLAVVQKRSVLHARVGRRVQAGRSTTEYKLKNIQHLLTTANGSWHIKRPDKNLLPSDSPFERTVESSKMKCIMFVCM